MGLNIIQDEYPARYKWKRITIGEVSEPLPFHKYQMILNAMYQDEKTGEIKTIKSYSQAEQYIDEEEMFEEAIRHAQSKLGGSNWILIEVLSVKYNDYYKVPKISATERYEEISKKLSP